MTTPAVVTASRPSRKLAFHYDWTGRRLSRTITDTNNAVLSATRWLDDGWNPVAEYAGQVLDKTYLWGMDMSGTMQGAGGVGGLLAVGQFDIQNSTFVIFHPSFDGNGNITAWTQSGASAPVCRREYDAFGNIVVEQGTAPCAIGFSTKIEDPETGLLYYGHRYYQPPTGRWLSKDPIEEEGGLNLYGFVGNDGVNWVDSLGQTPWIEFVSQWGESGDPKTPATIFEMLTNLPGLSLFPDFSTREVQPTKTILQGHHPSVQGVTWQQGAVKGEIVDIDTGSPYKYCPKLTLTHNVLAVYVDPKRTWTLQKPSYDSVLTHEIAHVRAKYVRYYRLVEHMLKEFPKPFCDCDLDEAKEGLKWEELDLTRRVAIADKLESDHDQSDSTIPTPRNQEGFGKFQTVEEKRATELKKK